MRLSKGPRRAGHPAKREKTPGIGRIPGVQPAMLSLFVLTRDRLRDIPHLYMQGRSAITTPSLVLSPVPIYGDQGIHGRLVKRVPSLDLDQNMSLPTGIIGRILPTGMTDVDCRTITASLQDRVSITVRLRRLESQPIVNTGAATIVTILTIMAGLMVILTGMIMSKKAVVRMQI